jgi:hypothetical protein
MPVLSLVTQQTHLHCKSIARILVLRKQKRQLNHPLKRRHANVSPTAVAAWSSEVALFPPILSTNKKPLIDRAYTDASIRSRYHDRPTATQLLRYHHNHGHGRISATMHILNYSRTQLPTRSFTSSIHRYENVDYDDPTLSSLSSSSQLPPPNDGAAATEQRIWQRRQLQDKYGMAAQSVIALGQQLVQQQQQQQQQEEDYNDSSTTMSTIQTKAALQSIHSFMHAYHMWINFQHHHRRSDTDFRNYDHYHATTTHSALYMAFRILECIIQPCWRRRPQKTRRRNKKKNI